MAVIDSAYQYYLSAYGPSATRYDTHKKSQLRAVYNDIVKVNKESPLYKIKYSGDVQKFAIDIKEKTRSIQNVIASLSESASDDDAANMFSKKIAQSSDESTVSVEYLGYDSNADDSVRFDVEVKHLATPQTNRGAYLSSDKCDIKPGTYTFDLSTNLSSYEFQYSVGPRDTNMDVQDKIIRLINNASVGLRASLVQNEKGQNAVEITSLQTGLSDNERYLFEVLPSPDNDSIKAMRTLGIDRVAEMASNSSFLLNGAERTSLSNTFTVNNSFELTLNNPTPEGRAAQIGFKTSTEAIAENVQSLVTVYNNIIRLGHQYSGSQQSAKLLRDMSGVARSYYNELESIGLAVENDGYIKVDRNLLTDAVVSEDAEDCFGTLNAFKNGLRDKASLASINPMNYVDKTLIAYKNPARNNFVTPYITSLYSGMMLDKIC